MCNKGEGGKGFTSLQTWVDNSPLYEEENQEQIWDKIASLADQDFGFANYFNSDVKALKRVVNRMNDTLTPTELERALYTECGDNSADNLYELILQIVSEETVSESRFFLSRCCWQ